MEFNELFPESKIAEYIRGIFDGIFSGFKPSVELFIATCNFLDAGLWDGFGEILFDMDPKSPDAKLLSDLRDNVHVFSAFKSHHSAELIGELIWDENGIKRSFKDFRADAMQMFGITHDTHLKTEFRTSVANGRSAAAWRDIVEDADLFPFMKYNTVGDERVRPDHEDYDGITRAVTDAFWKKHFPPNGFNCRCDVTKLTGLESGFKVTPKPIVKSVPPPPDLFQMNAGIDRVIFDPRHPYFTVADRYKVAAKENFDLPLKFGKHGEK